MTDQSEPVVFLDLALGGMSSPQSLPYPPSSCKQASTMANDDWMNKKVNPSAASKSNYSRKRCPKPPRTFVSFALVRRKVVEVGRWDTKGVNSIAWWAMIALLPALFFFHFTFYPLHATQLSVSNFHLAHVVYHRLKTLCKFPPASHDSK